MRGVGAVFYKQFKETMKNPAVLIQFIIFPLIAFVMSIFIVTEFDFEGVPADIAAIIAENMSANMPNIATMQAAIFVGFGLLMVMPGIISEDMEKKRLRLLMMAGVKPGAYLIGTSGVMLFASFFTSIAFSFVTGLSGLDFWLFTAAMMSAVVCSIILGSIFGILAGNQQAAAALMLPVSMIFGFGPMLAQFNDSIARFLHPFYTQQLNIAADYLTLGAADTALWESFAIMWANVAVLGILFAIVYKSKGLAKV